MPPLHPRHVTRGTEPRSIWHSISNLSGLPGPCNACLTPAMSTALDLAMPPKLASALAPGMVPGRPWHGPAVVPGACRYPQPLCWHGVLQGCWAHHTETGSARRGSTHLFHGHRTMPEVHATSWRKRKRDDSECGWRPT